MQKFYFILQTRSQCFHYQYWSWNDLPKSLTNSVHLTLEVLSFSMDVKDEETDEGTVADMGIPKETNCPVMDRIFPLLRKEYRKMNAGKR